MNRIVYFVFCYAIFYMLDFVVFLEKRGTSFGGELMVCLYLHGAFFVDQ
jgi:hypothetical protein